MAKVVIEVVTEEHLLPGCRHVDPQLHWVQLFRHKKVLPDVLATLRPKSALLHDFVLGYRIQVILRCVATGIEPDAIWVDNLHFHVSPHSTENLSSHATQVVRGIHSVVDYLQGIRVRLEKIMRRSLVIESQVPPFKAEHSLFTQFLLGDYMDTGVCDKDLSLLLVRRSRM